eukprot:81663-Hanusia_phi.AAC.1
MPVITRPPRAGGPGRDPGNDQYTLSREQSRCSSLIAGVRASDSDSPASLRLRFASPNQWTNQSQCDAVERNYSSISISLQ